AEITEHRWGFRVCEKVPNAWNGSGKGGRRGSTTSRRRSLTPPFAAQHVARQWCEPRPRLGPRGVRRGRHSRGARGGPPEPGARAGGVERLRRALGGARLLAVSRPDVRGGRGSAVLVRGG